MAGICEMLATLPSAVKIDNEFFAQVIEVCDQKGWNRKCSFATIMGHAPGGFVQTYFSDKARLVHTLSGTLRWEE